MLVYLKGYLDNVYYTMNKKLLTFSLVFVNLLQSAKADTVLDFSNGLSGWTIFGDATVQNGTVTSNPGGIPFSLTPPTGENMVQITPNGSTVGVGNNGTTDTIDATLGLNAGTMLSVVSTGTHTINGVNVNLTTTNYGGITKSLILN